MAIKTVLTASDPNPGRVTVVDYNVIGQALAAEPAGSTIIAIGGTDAFNMPLVFTETAHRTVVSGAPDTKTLILCNAVLNMGTFTWANNGTLRIFSGAIINQSGGANSSFVGTASSNWHFNDTVIENRYSGVGMWFVGNLGTAYFHRCAFVSKGGPLVSTAAGTIYMDNCDIVADASSSNIFGTAASLTVNMNECSLVRLDGAATIGSPGTINYTHCNFHNLVAPTGTNHGPNVNPSYEDYANWKFVPTNATLRTYNTYSDLENRSAAHGGRPGTGVRCSRTSSIHYTKQCRIVNGNNLNTNWTATSGLTWDTSLYAWKQNDSEAAPTLTDNNNTNKGQDLGAGAQVKYVVPSATYELINTGDAARVIDSTNFDVVGNQREYNFEAEVADAPVGAFTTREQNKQYALSGRYARTRWTLRNNGTTS